MVKKQKIWHNRCQCALCGDIIESKSVHDFVSCKCGAIFTDGGSEYTHRGFKFSSTDIINLSYWEEVEDDK